MAGVVSLQPNAIVQGGTGNLTATGEGGVAGEFVALLSGLLREATGSSAGRPIDARGLVGARTPDAANISGDVPADTTLLADARLAIERGVQVEGMSLEGAKGLLEAESVDLRFGQRSDIESKTQDDPVVPIDTMNDVNARSPVEATPPVGASHPVAARLSADTTMHVDATSSAEAAPTANGGLPIDALTRADATILIGANASLNVRPMVDAGLRVGATIPIDTRRSIGTGPLANSGLSANQRPLLDATTVTASNATVEAEFPIVATVQAGFEPLVGVLSPVKAMIPIAARTLADPGLPISAGPPVDVTRPGGAAFPINAKGLVDFRLPEPQRLPVDAKVQDNQTSSIVARKLANWNPTVAAKFPILSTAPIDEKKLVDVGLPANATKAANTPIGVDATIPTNQEASANGGIGVDAEAISAANISTGSRLSAGTGLVTAAKLSSDKRKSADVGVQVDAQIHANPTPSIVGSLPVIASVPIIAGSERETRGSADANIPMEARIPADLTIDGAPDQASDSLPGPAGAVLATARGRDSINPELHHPTLNLPAGQGLEEKPRGHAKIAKGVTSDTSAPILPELTQSTFGIVIPRLDLSFQTAGVQAASASTIMMIAPEAGAPSKRAHSAEGSIERPSARHDRSTPLAPRIEQPARLGHSDQTPPPINSAVGGTDIETPVLTAASRAEAVSFSARSDLPQIVPSTASTSFETRFEQSQPTSVGDHATPVSQIQFAMVSVMKTTDGAQSVTVRLQPPELGQVQIEVDRTAEGAARVNIIAERPETLRLLQRDQPRLEQVLDQAGILSNERSVSFQTAPPEQIAGAARPDSSSPGLNDPGQGQSGDAWRESQDGRREPGTGPSPDQHPAHARWFRAGLDITA